MKMHSFTLPFLFIALEAFYHLFFQNSIFVDLIVDYHLDVLVVFLLSRARKKVFCVMNTEFGHLGLPTAVQDLFI